MQDRNERFRTFGLLAPTLLLCFAFALPVLAQEPPSPKSPRSQVNLFVGHYGEILELDPNWAVEAEMKGDIESVRMFRRDKGEPPVASLYGRIENYTRYSLMQLVVIPRGQGAKSLKALYQAKEEALKKEKAERNIEYSMRLRGGEWPAGTFQVEIDSPYQALQYYSQSPTHFFILTAGYDLKSDAALLPVDANLTAVADSLEKHLARFYKTQKALVFLKEWDTWVWLGAANLIFLILAFLPQKNIWLVKGRTAGISLLIIFNCWVLYVTSVGYLCYQFDYEPFNSHITLSVPPSILMPFLGYWLAKRLKCDKPQRVFWSQAVIMLLELTMSLRWLGVPEAHTPLWKWAKMGIPEALISGIIFGIVFGLAFRPKPREDETS